MRFFIPVILLLSGALGVWIIHISRRAVGLAWLMAVAVSLASWGYGIASLSSTASSASIPWLPGTNSFLATLQFTANKQIGFYYILALTILLAVLLSAPTRLMLKSGPPTWGINLLNTSILLLALASENLVAWALTWTLMDGAYFLTTQFFLAQRARLQEDIFHLLARLAATLLLIGVVLTQPEPQQPLNIASISQGSLIALLLAIGLRMGLLPLRAASQDALPLRRGVWTILSISSPLAGLAVLAHLAPSSGTPVLDIPGLQTLLLLWGSINALLWLSASNALEGQPYWNSSFSALILACAFSGNFDALPSWGMIFVLLGSLPILFTLGIRPTRQIALFALLTFSALPLSPPSLGWQGLSQNAIGLLAWLWPAPLALLFTGFFRHSYRPIQSPAISERWILVAYILALLLVPLTAWVLWWFHPPVLVPGSIPQALITLGLTLLGISLILRRPTLATPTEEVMGQSLTLLQAIREGFVQFFSFNWLLEWTQRAGNLLLPLFTLVDEIFEGQSGLLWALVFLFLLLSLISVGQVNR